jgi:hypothetical protein
MADEQLSAAPRNYVIFSLLVVVALALAAREQFAPRSGRGEADRAIRLLIVGGSVQTAEELDEVDGFLVEHVDYADAVEHGRTLLADADAPAYAAAVAYADQYGYGFAALGRFDARARELDWQLDDDALDFADLPSPSAAWPTFWLFSVGDLAPRGPRVHAVALAPVHYDHPLAELDGLRLGLYEHPDLRALWESEPAVAQLQAREVLRNRGLREREDGIRADQRRWTALAESWPAPGVVAGNLAGAWEQVRAAPIHGGVLVEARAVTPWVSVYRRPRLQLDERASLYFVPTAALFDHDPVEHAARQRCVGLPEPITGELSVAHDGSAMVVRVDDEHADVYAFDELAAAEGRCVATLRGSLDIGERALGRPHAAGKTAWFDGGGSGGERVEWLDATGAHVAAVPGAYAYSGPFWLDADLLALVGEQAYAQPDVPELLLPTVMLIDTRAPTPAPLALDLRAHLAERAELYDLRPVDDHTLLLISERCGDEPLVRTQTCLHRLRSTAPLAELGADPTAFVLETLGRFGPEHALAIAADGSRIVWVADSRDPAEDHTLMTTDLRGSTLAPVRVDADLLPDSDPRISADGRLVISSVPLELGELGAVSVARVLTLPPGPTSD